METTEPKRSWRNFCRAQKTAKSSSWLIWRPCSSLVHTPDAKEAPRCAPHLCRDASVNRVCSGGAPENGAPFRSISGASHQFKSSRHWRLGATLHQSGSEAAFHCPFRHHWRERTCRRLPGTSLSKDVRWPSKDLHRETGGPLCDRKHRATPCKRLTWSGDRKTRAQLSATDNWADNWAKEALTERIADSKASNLRVHLTAVSSPLTLQTT